MKLSSRNRMLVLGAPLVAAVAALGMAGKTAQAEDATELHERCATRLSIAFLGESPSATLIADANPQGQVDTMLADAKFQERFSRFVNSQFNDDVGTKPSEDAPYYLAKYVLQNGKPWKDLFIGPYKVDLTNTADQNSVAVQDDPNGLGYFRSTPWLIRYAGNEQAGYKLSTAYHMLNNTLGLQLVASTNAPGADVSATGRQNAACSGCHYDPWYALDKVARTLTRVNHKTNPVTFTPSTDGPQQILGGVTVADDKQLVETLVNSEAFNFRVCRMSFQYLYGRAENKCEGPIFDKCMTEFKSKGTMQAALAAVAKDPSFCQ